MRLPSSPSLSEIQAHIPHISAVRQDLHRPFWSVMIPTYNAGHYLRKTLESVLSQDPGSDEMQIEVIDGCSTTDDPIQIVRELGKGRVAFYRLPSNRGPAHTFNICIERSRGRWIHILHGDDMVAQGFYVAYRSAILSHPEARTIIGQVIRIDEADRWIGVSSVPLPVEGGAITDFARLQATTQLVQFPAVVVHRDAYERVGGFCTLFKHVCDWDMWFRLGQFSSIATVPRPYGLYRKHNESDTSQQVISANNMREIYFVVSANIIRLNGADSLDGEKGWRSRLASFAETIAWELSEKNCTKGRFNQALWAWRLEPKIGRLVMLMKSWLKHKLNRASKE